MITIGKYKLGHDEDIVSYPVMGGGLSKLTKITFSNIAKLSNITQFYPVNIHVGHRQNGRKSFYIEGHINGQPILFARKETDNPTAGQTNIYSEYAKHQFSKLITKPLNEILTELRIL
jgi:hypothetical protein